MTSRELTTVRCIHNRLMRIVLICNARGKSISSGPTVMPEHSLSRQDRQAVAAAHLDAAGPSEVTALLGLDARSANLLNQRPRVTPAGAVNREHPCVQQALDAVLQGGDLIVVEHLGHLGRHGLCERGDVLQ